MKKMFAYLCAGVMVLSLAACGNGDKTGESQGSAAGSQTESSAAAGNQAGNGAGDQTAGGTGAGGQTAGGSGTGDTAQGGTLGDNGHDYEEGWTEEMEGIKAAVLEQVGENYFPNMPLMPDMLEAQFGITSDMYDDYFAEMPMISANVDTLLIIRAKDDKVEDVEAAIEAYRDIQINGALQYPMNIGKVQASRIGRFGNYVCFVQLGGDVMEIMDNGDEAVIIHCQEMNDQVLEIIGQNVGHE